MSNNFRPGNQCSANTRAKLRTLRHLWGAELATDTVVDTEVLTHSFLAKTTAPGNQTRGILQAPPAATTSSSIEFEVPDNMTARVDFMSAIRARSNVQTALPATGYPSAYLGAPFRLSVYRIFVSDGGVVTLDPTFVPISRLVTRSQFNAALFDPATPALYYNDTVGTNTISEKLSTGVYSATITIETDGDVTSAPPTAYWVSVNLNGAGTSGWVTSAFTQPFSQVGDIQVVVPPLLQIRATFEYAGGSHGSVTPPQTAVYKQYTCTNQRCIEIAAPNGDNLTTCLGTCA